MDNLQTVLMVLDWAVMLLQIAVQALVMIGFVRIAVRPDGSPVWHMAMGMIALNAAYAFRSFYWIVVPIEVREVIGKEPPNIAMSLLVLAASLFFLRMLLLLIHEAERREWNIITAAFYPRRLERLLDSLFRRKV
ncbi:hypothetical protein [Falsirhodobacter sp. 20TX0035]|uniref:hypothetical protein n=1 Tax=Falsirhodobacter sp. 20TX0035 TaxID=3022019 RepID=UPI00232CA833|nr:hypothetical protein [Falsirhodobacter sp. 20TX0035]MDB6454280.1 hypothetical protein [Falsirhodobacter sp. 20TX0035]